MEAPAKNGTGAGSAEAPVIVRTREDDDWRRYFERSAAEEPRFGLGVRFVEVPHLAAQRPQLGLHPRSYLVDYWTETVRAVGARRVVLIHWDDFFRPLTEPLRALPYAGDDLDVSMRILDELAAQDGVALHMPTVWRRENPWM